ncbi:MAG TPA: SUMF1/EgtB/PvdO family nonheme iron enzyme, partial [Blastocatellia bacterium]|nr:SUMF1/EgtB/PvdO family nonheme iron enzyme [Blastocatellia bacterium]
MADFEPEMVTIPAGDFLMGCDQGAGNERPSHRVRVDRFAMARTAVTNRLYQLFIHDSGRRAPASF